MTLTAIRTMFALFLSALTLTLGTNSAAAQDASLLPPAARTTEAGTPPGPVAMEQAPPARSPLPRTPAKPGGFQGWQIEAHAGVVPVSRASGKSQLPTPGAAFINFQGAPTRRVPSWYFGDGAQLANQGATSSGVDSRITPLDPVLTSASAERQSGAILGFRVGRAISRHALAELNVDLGQSHTTLRGDALRAIEATRTSFSGFFDTMLRLNPNAGNPSVRSIATIVDDQGTQLMVTGDVEIAVASIVALTPYVTLGGGFVRPRGTDPSLVLIGTYDFTQNMPGSAIDGAPVHETDHVLVHFNQQSATLALIGGGVQRDLTSHTGFRADARLFLRATRTRIVIDAEPSSAVVNPGGRIVRGGGLIQISSQEGFPSTLSHQVERFQTFDGTGNQFSVTAGYFLRF